MNSRLPPVGLVGPFALMPVTCQNGVTSIHRAAHGLLIYEGLYSGTASGYLMNHA